MIPPESNEARASSLSMWCQYVTENIIVSSIFEVNQCGYTVRLHIIGTITRLVCLPINSCRGIGTYICTKCYQNSEPGYSRESSKLEKIDHTPTTCNNGIIV